MSLSRYHDWPERLNAFIEGRRRVPFIWNVNDCGTFASAAIEAMTGVNPRDGIAEYSGARTALTAIDFDLEAFAEHRAYTYGCPEIPVKMARRGDLAFHEHGALGTLGVVGAGMKIFAPGETGVDTLPLLECHRAWRIG